MTSFIIVNGSWPLPRPNGNILVLKAPTGELGFHWRDGPLVMVSGELLHDEPHLFHFGLNRQLTIGPFELEVLGFESNGDIVAINWQWNKVLS